MPAAPPKAPASSACPKEPHCNLQVGHAGACGLLRDTNCRDCGNPDCPNVSATPYWRRCPATDRTRATQGTWDGFGWPPAID